MDKQIYNYVEFSNIIISNQNVGYTEAKTSFYIFKGKI